MKPGRCWAAAPGRAALFCVAAGPVFGVIERSTGAVGWGAVRVGGACWKVRKPRLPKLPPRRASA
jgi:hypothetical protein